MQEQFHWPEFKEYLFIYPGDDFKLKSFKLSHIEWNRCLGNTEFKIFTKAYYKDLKKPANENHWNPFEISDYFYDIDNIDYKTGGYRNSSAVPNRILRIVSKITVSGRKSSLQKPASFVVETHWRDIKSRIIKIEAVEKNGAVKWPKLNEMRTFPYYYNQRFLKAFSSNIEIIRNTSLSDAKKTDFLNSTISFCSQMILRDKITQAINKGVVHTSKISYRSCGII